ncbi:phage portal protein [Fictibacillus phosphorivorans]|uniref:phage portal protein n=1 Tax=Fictibacillus phosphorivorans TaxID=1221500 RepID=UPI003CEDB8D9
MGIFAWNSSKKNEPRDLFSETLFTSNPPVKITEENALSIPAVKASIELITNSIAQLPIYMYVEKDNGIEKYEDHRTALLNDAANKYTSSQVLKKMIVQDYLLRGKAYLYQKSGKLYHLPSKNVTESKFTDDNGLTFDEKEFEVITHTGKTVTLQEHEVIVIDSGTYGLLHDAGNLLNTALSQQEYNRSLLSNGALPLGMVKVASRLTEQALTRLKASWDGLYSGTKKVGKTVFLEEGMEYKPFQLRPDELQMTDSQKHITSEIARVFNLPESMINSSANKYNSLSQNNLQFLRSTLSPIITSIEKAFDHYLLAHNEKLSGYFFRFDTSELLRTTEEEKVKITAEAFQKGLISFNQAAYRLDLPKSEKDYHLLTTGVVLKYVDGSFEYPNLGPQQSKEGEQPINEDGIKDE